MAKNRSKENELGTRQAENYERRERDNTFQGVFKKGANLPIWTPAKGDHEINIIPYFAGKNDPRVPEGGKTYVLEVYQHFSVGPRDVDFVCLDAMYGKACPVCELRNKLRKQDPPDSEREKKKWEDELRSLSPSRRVIYNVEVVTTEKEAEKGVQVFPTSHHNMERNLLSVAKLPKRRGGGHIIFADEDEGRTIAFTREGERMQTKYLGHTLYERDPLPDELLEKAYVLDEYIHIPTYEEVKEALYGEAPDDEEDVDEGVRRTSRGRWDTGDDGEEEPPRRRARRPRDDEGEGGGEEGDEPRRARRAREEPEDGEEDAPRRRRRSAEPEEEGDGEEDRPTRRSRRSREEPADDEEDSPPRRSRRGREEPADEGDGEEDAPRRRRRSAEPEEEGDAEPEKPKKRGGRMPTIPSDDDKGPVCPVAKGVFGEDADMFDKCDDCDLYPECVKLSNKNKRSKR